MAEKQEIAIKERREADEAAEVAEREKREAEEAEAERKAASARQARAEAQAAKLARIEAEAAAAKAKEKADTIVLLPEEWQRRIVMVHQALDGDGGGSIDASELNDIDERVFEAMMKASNDGDGQIDEEEFLIFFGKMYGDRGHEVAEGLLTHLEKHVQKQLEAARVAHQQLLEAYKKAAAALSVEQRFRVNALHKQLDVTLSGTIEKAELVEVDEQGKMFETLDEKGGTVRPEAFVAFMGTMKKERGPKVAEGFIQHLEAYVEEKKWKAVKDLEAKMLIEWSEATALLSEEMRERAEGLFHGFDSLGNSDGVVQKCELADSDKHDDLFQKLDVTFAGHITRSAWTGYFGKMLQEEGEKRTLETLDTPHPLNPGLKVPSSTEHPTELSVTPFLQVRR